MSARSTAQPQAKPFKNQSDDYLAVAASLSMTMLFLCSIIVSNSVKRLFTASIHRGS